MRLLIWIILGLLFSLSRLVMAQTPASPSCDSDNHLDFDFWVGSWQVTTPDGKPAGTNTIRKIQDGCILHESWVSATSGYTGTSYNFYNSQTGEWQQLWIDNQGNHLELKGKRVGDQMILRSDNVKKADGEGYFHRITWTNNDDGSVRQLWETIAETNNVTIVFDGLYRSSDMVEPDSTTTKKASSQ